MNKKTPKNEPGAKVIVPKKRKYVKKSARWEKNWDRTPKNHERPDLNTKSVEKLKQHIAFLENNISKLHVDTALQKRRIDEFRKENLKYKKALEIVMQNVDPGVIMDRLVELYDLREITTLLREGVTVF